MPTTVTLLERVSGFLEQAGVAHALIGAGALAVHGVSRSTVDQDLLTTDTRVLADAFWEPLDGVRADVRRGDSDDPLAGVVAIGQESERDVDVIVGRHGWQRDAVMRAAVPGGIPVPVVQAGDLVLLKLYAGGAQDLWDIEQLLAVTDAAPIREHVARVIDALPPRCAELWARWRRNE